MISSEGASPSATADRPAGATAGARLAVVVNRDGGTVLRLGASQLGARLAAAFAGAGADAELLFVPGAEMDATLREARERALGGDLDGVVVGGGDGSVSGAAGMLAGTGVPLGVLPLGTLNHFAKDLGMPADPAAAAALIALRPARGRRRRGQWPGVRQQFAARDLSLHGRRPRATALAARARQMDGDVAGVPAHAGPLPAPPADLVFAGSRLPVRTPSLLVGVNAYDPQLFAIRRPDLDRGELFVVVARHASLSASPGSPSVPHSAA